MANRCLPGVWATAAGCLLGLVVACTPMATGSNALMSNAPERSPASSTPTAAGPVTTVRVLQLNLCNSGIAACYTGRARTQAAAVIRAEAPDLVTLNEVCRDDLPPLRESLANAFPGADVVSAFQAAHDRRTGAEFRCRNGESDGIGLVSRWPSVPGSTPGGVYPDQDLQDPEERVWLCLTAQSTPAITTCTTHLDDRKREVAVAQCDYLFQTVITKVHQEGAADPVVLGGDLNLGSGDDPDLRSCLPADFGVADDGGVQHIVATPGLAVTASRTIDLGDTTDHPGLLVTLAIRSCGGGSAGSC